MLSNICRKISKIELIFTTYYTNNSINPETLSFNLGSLSLNLLTCRCFFFIITYWISFVTVEFCKADAAANIEY